MGYNATEMGVRVKLRPAEARGELRSLLERVGGDVVAGAREFGVTRRTFDRWLAALGLQETAAAFRAKVSGTKAAT